MSGRPHASGSRTPQSRLKSSGPIKATSPRFDPDAPALAPSPIRTQSYGAQSLSALRSGGKPSKYGGAEDYYDDAVDYTTPYASAPRRGDTHWPRAGYPTPEGWTERTYQLNERPHSPSRTQTGAPSPSASSLPVTNPLLIAKRGYPSPLQTDYGCAAMLSLCSRRCCTGSVPAPADIPRKTPRSADCCPRSLTRLSQHPPGPHGTARGPTGPTQ